MMKRVLMSIHVRGNEKEYYFFFDGDPDCLQGWWDDGLEIDEVVDEVDCSPELYDYLVERNNQDDERLNEIGGRNA